MPDTKTSLGTWPRNLAFLLLGGLAALPLARAQRPEAPTETPRPSADEPDREARLAEARIEVRVLEGRLGVKQAELKLEQARLDFARQLKKSVEETTARTHYTPPAAASVAALDVLNEEARVVAKRAEMDEASLRYQEAKRRLDAGELPPTGTIAQADLDRRLTEVEREIDQLEDRVFGMSRSKLKDSYK